jgi:predicted Zn-dependent protease
VLISVPLAIVGLLVGFMMSASLSSKNGAKESGATTRSSAAPTVAPSAAPNATATSDELAAATSAGSDALAELVKKHPNDAKIRVALGGAELAQREPERAVAALRDALALDPNLKNDAQIASALWMAAQNKRSSTAALELLKGPMGDRGTSILRDLSETAGVRDQVKKDARAALSEMKVRK